MEEKKLLRETLKNKLAKLTLPSYEQLSYLIARRLFEDDSWKKASAIGITISRNPEVDTFQVIRKAWEQNKRVFVPKCDPQSRGLDFRELTRFDQLESVFFGLYEPIVSETDPIDPSDIDLIVVPGLAFTRNGYRLGFGGGYYDRLLANYDGRTLALAFDHQLVPDIPTEPHDISVDKIITNNEVIESGS